MGVNHDQFSHFSHLRPGSSAAILQMVVILGFWPQIAPMVIFRLKIGPGSRGEYRQVVFVEELWCCRGDGMGVNHDQFSHFSRLRPSSPTLILQMVW